MKRHIGKISKLIQSFSTYLYAGWRSRLFKPYVKLCSHHFACYFRKFQRALYLGGVQTTHISDQQLKKMQRLSKGLHTLLPSRPDLTYSVIFSVKAPKVEFFRTSLESVLHQSPEALEMLIGFSNKPTPELEKIVSELSRSHPNKIRVFDFPADQERESIENQLAEKASGNFLFFMGQEDWIRPDLLFRYEQTLRIFAEPEKIVLYCDVHEISDNNYFIPQSKHQQPSQLNFPYFFKLFLVRGFLIPKGLWQKTAGWRSSLRGAEEEDLLLQLDVAGATFQHIPFCLYAVRASTYTRQRQMKSRETFLHSLEHYTQAKNLDWKWSTGYQSSSVRAVPAIMPGHRLQVIIPYKDQKELTLKCVHSLLKQQGVDFTLTAVDNRSTDSSIAENIRRLGGEVLFIDEPFNYSRLNNLAVKRTQKATDCDILVFLNNDVELEPEALQEMLRWMDQPQIGMVGCRLHYPDGRLQHGGVSLNTQEGSEMWWEHVEKFRSFKEMDVTKALGVFDAVTAACAMVKRDTFLEVGGFDEVWYPIGYSDTNLAVKLGLHGLKSFYTPYAVGIHYESVSRQTSIEDFENSWWLHQLLLKNRKKPSHRQ
jgi:GT2 family glycosyltransferase